MIAFVAVLLIMVHGLDGREIYVSVEEITSLHGRIPGKGNMLFADGVNCIIYQSDGKNVSVVETCTEVRDKIITIQGGEHERRTDTATPDLK